MAALNGWCARSGTLGDAGTTSLVTIAGATAMGGHPADNMIIVNTGTIGKLLVAFSQDGSSFTSGVASIGSNLIAPFQDCNANQVKLDGSEDNVTYSLTAWRSGRQA